MGMRLQTSTRRLADTAFAASSNLSLPLPRDAVGRKLVLVLHGSVVTTFASGSPAAPRESTFDTLISQIILNVDGRVVKNVRPHMLHMFEILAHGQEGERKSSAGASAVANDNPTADGGFAWGTTTQTTTVREVLEIPFEMFLAEVGSDKTWLDLRGASLADLKMISGPFSGLDTTGAPVVFTSQTFVIEAYLEEVLGVEKNADLADFQQIWGQETVTAQVSEKSFEMTTGNLIAGYGLYVKNGASPAVPTDNGVTDIKIMAGNKIIKQGHFNQFQAEMRQIYGVNAARVSNVSRADGFVYIPLLTQKKNLFTAFDARGLNSVRLVLSTAASSVVTYNLAVNIEQHIIAQVKG